MKIVNWIFIFAIAFCFGCNIYNPPEQIPSYIHINNITCSVSDSTAAGQGSKSSSVSDAWVYIDEQIIGCFELPKTFPVLYEGTHKLKIRAGIKVNGIAATRSPYPFYHEYEEIISLRKGEIISVSPVVTYLASTHFDIIEDFESIGVKISNTQNSDTTFQVISNPNTNIFEGNNCGIAYLDNVKTSFEGKTVDSFLLNGSQTPVFLEFNYKCNHQFSVNLGGYNPTSLPVGVLNLNQSVEWKKAYLYLTPAISQLQPSTYFRVYFDMFNEVNADSLALLIDNFKLVHF